MANRLKDYFPVIRERQEILKEIAEHPQLKEMFHSWSSKQQKEFLDFCTGVRGLKLLYDGFFKEVMNPETKPQRMNDFLSQILRQEVKVIKVLPADSTRLADEGSLVIMDIVVELEDGSIANVEVQRIGYLFPGQRCACYSADLLLRQYKRVRDEKKKKFSYRDVKSVYTIVLFEQSPAEFKNFPDVYYHYFEQKSCTGLELELLQKYIMIPLDIYREKVHNKIITSKLDAWLGLFSMDDPETVVDLITTYPEFKEIYQEAYSICRNMENIMGIFSEELYELDRNTVQYMIDEMQDKLNEQRDRLNEQKEELNEQKNRFNEQEKKINEQKIMINEQKIMINEQESTINKQESTINKQESTINKQESTINKQESTINKQESTINEQKSTINKQESTINKQKSTINKQESTINKQKSMINEQESTINEQKSMINEQESTINEQKSMINEQESTINEQENTINTQKTELNKLQGEVEALKKQMNMQNADGIRNTVEVLRRLGLPIEKILTEIINQYGLDGAQAEEYLR